MSADEAMSQHQVGEMVNRLRTQGGFTYDPRAKKFLTSGYSVAAHPAAEMRMETPAGGVTEAHLHGYIKGSAPIWKQQKAQGRGQEAIGAWHSEATDTKPATDVVDLPKVYPATPTGHMKSRQAQILRNQEASFSLHELKEDPNPWFTGTEQTPTPGRLSQQFPEFGNLVAKKPRVALDPEKYPEVTHWSEQPTRDARAARAARRRP